MMRILYGVQATGNGHITRARTMATTLKEAGLQVDYLFSGRPREDMFSMAPFGEYRCLSGLTFSIHAGRIQYMKTVFNNNIARFIHDIRTLDLDGYDLVITDFEPVTAWAAHIKKKPAIAIGHQYAFFHDIPKAKDNFLASAIIRYFAPAETQIGLHWDPFNAPILPPLIEPPKYAASIIKDMILVYLPFEDIPQIIQWFKLFPEHQFIVYCATEQMKQVANMSLKPFSRTGFQEDLARCEGVISNSGFELASEALQYGKKILVKPLKGQMEQWSNAAALTILGIGDEMADFNADQVRAWLKKPNPGPLIYPNVARTLTQWICNGRQESIQDLSSTLWAGIRPQTRPEISAMAPVAESSS